MPRITVGSQVTGAASGALRDPATNNAFNGVPPPDYITGTHYVPQYFIPDGSTVTTTATRLYYVPIYIWQARSFSGVITYNQGAGDNGETYRVGLYTHSATNGPRSLVLDFGQVTLTAASAVRTLSNAASVPAAAWYWLALHFNAATAMYGMESAGAQVTAAGYYPNTPIQGFFGLVGSGSFGGNTLAVRTRYVDTAYGALAATAVAPTNDLSSGSPAVALLP